jgi:hypothetical protein
MNTRNKEKIILDTLSQPAPHPESDAARIQSVMRAVRNSTPARKEASFPDLLDHWIWRTVPAAAALAIVVFAVSLFIGEQDITRSMLTDPVYLLTVKTCSI